MNSEMLTTADIAGHLNLTRTYVTDQLTKRADFPKPALRLSRKTVLWTRESVEAWLVKMAKKARA